jgi:hypothetical protein
MDAREREDAFSLRQAELVDKDQICAKSRKAWRKPAITGVVRPHVVHEALQNQQLSLWKFETVEWLYF